MGIFRAVLHPKEHFQQQKQHLVQKREAPKNHHTAPPTPPTPPSEPTSPIVDERPPFRTVTSLPAATKTNVSRAASSCSSHTSQSIHTISAGGLIQSHHTQPNQPHNNDRPRFLINPDGVTHQHCIKCMPPSKLSASLQNLAAGLGGVAMKGLKIPLVKGTGLDKKPCTSEAVQKERAAVNAELRRAPNDVCLSEKWGTCHEVIGKGAFGVVRIVHKPDASGTEYAVKVTKKKDLCFFLFICQFL